MPLILFGITLVTFLLFNVAGGDPATMHAGKHASEEQIAEIRRELGLDRPLHMQYVFYVKQIASLDFGRSWATRQKITDMILDGIPASLSLTFPAFMITLVVTISIALLLVFLRGPRFGEIVDKSVMVVCLAAMSISSLVYILFLQYFLGYQLGWFPITGWDPDWVGRWEYLILPILIYVVLSLGSNILFYRTIFMDEIFQDYVRTARSKGLGPKAIMLKHVLRNALIPIITITVVQLPFLILGTLLLEAFFGIPGLGGLLYSALGNADFPVIKAMVFMSAVLYMFAQLLTDILYALVDPKVKLS